MKKILFPTDFSDNALHASLYAAMLANRLDAEIVMLNVYSIPVFTEFQVPYSDENFYLYGKKEAEDNLKEFVTKFIHKTHISKERVNELIRYGNAADNIVETANNIHADMIVIGTKGASNILDKWLGTNAQKVMENAKCPVWIIPNDTEINFPKTILYAADFKEDEELAMNKILTIAKPLEATCKVIHIHEYVEMNINHEVQHMVNSLENTFEDDDVTFKNLNRGDVVKGLETYLSTTKPDVLAMAIHEKSFLNKIFISSVSEHFVYKGKLPMLTFRK